MCFLRVLKNIIILLSRLNRAFPESIEGSPEPIEGCRRMQHSLWVASTSSAAKFKQF